MPSQARNLANKFVGHLKNLEVTRNKVELLFNSKALVRRDVEHVYKGLFMDACASFEDFLEDLFIGLIVGNLRNRKTRLKQIHIKSYLTARKIIFGKDKYLNWLPYTDNTLERAKIYFSQGKPFDLDEDDVDMLDKIHTIRNALAHNSIYCKKQFQKKIISNRTLLPKEKAPTGFLRTISTSNPPTTFFEIYANKLSTISLKLTS